MKTLIFSFFSAIVLFFFDASNGDSGFLPVVEPAVNFLNGEGDNAEAQNAGLLQSSSAVSWEPPIYPHKIYPYGAKDLGCYVDNSSNPDLPIIVDYNVYPAECHRLCNAKNFKYFGLQNGNECRCGHSYGCYGSASSNECSSNCASLPGVNWCGGQGFNKVFEIHGDFPKGGVVVGCYLPSEYMTDQKLEGDFSVEKCIKTCRIDLQTSYAAVLEGNKCQCGDKFGEHGHAEFSLCEVFPCQGSEQNYCGSTYGKIVYKLDEYYNDEVTMFVKNASLNYYKTINFSKKADGSSVYFHVPEQQYVPQVGYSDKKLWSQDIETNEIKFKLLRQNNLVYYDATLTAYKLRGGKRSHISNGFNIGTGKLGFYFDATAINPPLPYGEYTAKFDFIGLGWHKPYKSKITVDIDFNI